MFRGAVRGDLPQILKIYPHARAVMKDVYKRQADTGGKTMSKVYSWRELNEKELTRVYLGEMRRDFPPTELKPLSMILNSEADGTAHTSVSYTHLDVYKRQLHRCLRAVPMRRGPHWPRCCPIPFCRRWSGAP